MAQAPTFLYVVTFLDYPSVPHNARSLAKSEAFGNNQLSRVPDQYSTSRAESMIL